MNDHHPLERHNFASTSSICSRVLMHPTMHDISGHYTNFFEKEGNPWPAFTANNVSVWFGASPDQDGIYKCYGRQYVGER